MYTEIEKMQKENAQMLVQDKQTYRERMQTYIQPKACNHQTDNYILWATKIMFDSLTTTLNCEFQLIMSTNYSISKKAKTWQMLELL